MKNLEMKVEGNILAIKVDLTKGLEGMRLTKVRYNLYDLSEGGNDD